MAIKTFSVGEVLTASDTNTFLANSGLVYITSTTVGSGVSSVAVTNVFSSTYDNYRILYSGGNMSASSALKMQIGNATTGYYGVFVYGVNTGTTVSAANDNNTSSFTYVGGNSDTITTHMAVDVISPNLTHQTALSAQMVHYGTNFGTYTGVLANTTSYTGFTLIPFSGTMTGGTITVYGYRKA